MTSVDSAEIDPPRRALILAGGGLKVAFQAGVLQVWLDEARTPDGHPLVFDLADGASGGVFNLAMWCQGLTGRQIADNWRDLRPLLGISVNWRRWLPSPLSVLDYRRFRKNVLRGAWDLDWGRIRGTSSTATFNLYNFTEQRAEVRTADTMDEDALISAVSLPMWFPPVPLAGGDYIDAVYATDANLEAAIERGAEELWIIWTVSQRGTWRPGFVPAYFQIIEAAANSRVRAVLERIERNNAADDGRGGEFGRRIEVKWLGAEVPAHYLFNFSQASMHEAVERGVAQARVWCRAEGLMVVSNDPPTGGGTVTFRETMAGAFAFGETRPEVGAADGAARDSRLSVHLRVTIPDVDRFVLDQRHCAAVVGEVRCDALGGVCTLLAGEVELLTDDGDPYRKRLTYRLLFCDADHEEITLIGNKTVVHQPDTDDLWPDTSTLAIRLYRGNKMSEHLALITRASHDMVGSGVLRLAKTSFARQLTTFRATSGQVSGPGRTLFVFAQFFLRQLGQVYLHRAGREMPPQFSPPTPQTPGRLVAPAGPVGPKD